MKLKYIFCKAEKRLPCGKATTCGEKKLLWVRRSERGASLMETVTALSILSFVGLAAIAGVFTSVKSNDMARTRISAESLARSEIEYISRQPYVTAAIDYTLPTSPTYPAEWDTTAHAMPEGYTGYSIRVSSSGVYGQSSIQKVAAVVSYMDGKVLTIETYRAQY
jgi:Tfp pilus assembly protein PilV